MEVKRDILWRVYLCFIGIGLFSLVVLGRAFYIQRVEGDYWRGLSDSLHQKFIELEAERGTIYSADGEMLSTSIPYFDIYMDFGAEGLREKNGKRFRENVDSFAIAISQLFKNKTVTQYKKELRLAYNNKNRYYLLKKGLSFDQYKAFRSFPLVRLGRNKSGVIVEVKSKRLNPFGLLAKRTIGLAREHAQNVGLERTYDSVLKGVVGRRLVRYLAGGVGLPVEGYEIEPENGKDVITTLDVIIQDITENALLKVLEEHEAQYGTCIVMETKTGKIKAIANLGRTKKGTYDENLNYALQTNEPGSTIKLATLLAVLDAGKSRITDHVPVGSTGYAYVGVRSINDHERAPKPDLTVKECFAYSSNIGMGILAYNAFASNPDLFKQYLKKFHLDRKAGVGLVGEEVPLLPRWKRNKEGLHAMVTMSFGYAIEVSPLQTLMLYNAVANGGKMVRPYLVQAIKSNAITLKEFNTEIIDESICKPEVVKAAQKCLEAVVTEGTAKTVFEDIPFPVAGKTGTAHVAGGDVKYYDGMYQASFAGYFPANNPEYTCIVVIKTAPHAALHYGGQLAAPVFKEIAAKLYALYVQRRNGGEKQPLNLDSTEQFYAGNAADVRHVMESVRLPFKNEGRNTDWNVVVADENGTVVKDAAINNKVFPDVRNMTLKDALYLLENMDVKVTLKGKGKVVAQSVQPGIAVQKNTTVTLLLN